MNGLWLLHPFFTVHLSNLNFYIQMVPFSSKHLPHYFILLLFTVPIFLSFLLFLDTVFLKSPYTEFSSFIVTVSRFETLQCPPWTYIINVFIADLTLLRWKFVIFPLRELGSTQILMHDDFHYYVYYHKNWAILLNL